MGQAASTELASPALALLSAGERAMLEDAYKIMISARGDKEEVPISHFADQWRMLDPTSRRGLARAFAAGHTEAVTKIAFLGSAAELLQGSTEDRALFCMDWALHFDDPTPGAEPSAAVTHKTEVALPRLRRNLGAPTSRDRRSLLMAAGGRPVTLKRMLDFITAVASASLRLLRVLDGYKDPLANADNAPFDGQVAPERFVLLLLQQAHFQQAQSLYSFDGATQPAVAPLPESYSVDDFVAWYRKSVTFQQLLNVFITFAFSRPEAVTAALDRIAHPPTTSSPVPQEVLKDREDLLRLPHINGKSALLSDADIWWLGTFMPHHLRRRWRLLFTDTIHGMSWARMSSQIQDQGPTLVIIEDEEGARFGGWASQSWSRQPGFYGDETSFLMTLSPKLAAYQSSRLNNHFQYFNYSTKTLPNGLGMGGQFDYFGLWLPESLEGGHSKAEPLSTTYSSPQLSHSQVFKIKHIEVWACGPEPKKEDDGPSILDQYKEDRVILEWAGRQQFSQGQRNNREIEYDDDA